MRLLLTFTIMLLAAMLPFAAEAGKFTLVIDAGHGGKDVGCEGKNTYEKDVNLAVALAFGELVNKNMGKKVDVVYTRNKDTYLSLEQRAQIANDRGADLFVSIHVNSVEKSTKGRESLHGTSVYIFPPDKAERNSGVLHRRSKVTEVAAKGKTARAAYNSKSPESKAAFDLLQADNISRSADFGKMILKEMTARAGRADKGLRQGPFYVIWAVAAPSVLVELEYMCNPAQESFIKSPEGVKKLSTALYEAFNNYYKRYYSQS